MNYWILIFLVIVVAIIVSTRKKTGGIVEQCNEICRYNDYVSYDCKDLCDPHYRFRPCVKKCILGSELGNNY